MLLPNRPNPFRRATDLRFTLTRAEDVSLEVYDVSGRNVATLIAGRRMEAGPHRVEFRAGSLRAGIYLARLRAGAKVEVRRMALVP
jgi:hypothetical protein